jgi:two-component system, NtrC family, response regulator PilR
MKSILVVDDEASIREMLEIMLAKEGYRVTTAANGTEALQSFKKHPAAVVLTDIRMRPLDGLALLKEIKNLHPRTEVIMISAFADTETAVEAMNEGAYDYFPKPFDIVELKSVIQSAFSKYEGQPERPTPAGTLLQYQTRPLIGNSPQMKRVSELIQRSSQVVSNVLITGESGTGKELVAHLIHENSQRRDFPFVTVSCAGIPETLIESELFGYRKGAFTGAQTNKIGLVETAHRGTLFLDEIGELSPTMQVKLLRLLQEKSFTPLGGTDERLVDIRFILATNRNLEKEVMEGRFREDLFYRINVISIQLPSLRERPEDIPLLAHQFLENYSRSLGKKINKISSYALKVLSQYPFPGNVRELENIIERSVAMERSTIVLPESLALAAFKGVIASTGELPQITLPGEGLDLDQTMDKIEKNLIIQALKRALGNKQRTANLLKINLRSLRYRMIKHGLEQE